MVQDWLQVHSISLNDLLNNEDDWILINRDLNGRVRLILPERIKESEQRTLWISLAKKLMQRLGKHAIRQMPKFFSKQTGSRRFKGRAVIW